MKDVVHRHLHTCGLAPNEVFNPSCFNKKLRLSLRQSAEDLSENPSYILIGEDDADDRFLLQAAFEENGFRDELRFAENGVDLLSQLADIPVEAPDATFPRFILLDLNMPKKDGREVLKEIKGSPRFRSIPIVIFSTTNNEVEMKRCYELGANSYITKPNSFDSLLKTVASLRSYWLQTVDVPMV